jgi:hypothetical protein
VTASATRTASPDGRFGTIRAQLQADSLETVATIASEALETWSTSETDPTVPTASS